jgi:uncharacterized protein YodC (DUF2158 family)
MKPTSWKTKNRGKVTPYRYGVRRKSNLSNKNQFKEKVMAAKSSFNVGEIVQLKSGGPEMTVQLVPEKPIGLYKCQWFAGKKLESGLFPFDSLKLVTQETK